MQDSERINQAIAPGLQLSMCSFSLKKTELNKEINFTPKKNEETLQIKHDNILQFHIVV